MPTPRFRIVSEGPTDFAVIRRILAGIFSDLDIEVERLPEPNPSVVTDPDNFGGWNNLMAFLGSSRFEEAFNFTDFVVVHIDTDTCQDFGVKTHENGSRLPDREIAARVITQLRSEISAAWDRISARVIFAISVDSIECWLLVIYVRTGQPARSQNCLEHLNRALSAKNERVIPTNKKPPLYYDRLAMPFSKWKDLEKLQGSSESLALFVEEVQRVTQR